MVMRQLMRPGPLLYAAAWALLAPVGLVLWAVATAESIPLPALHSPAAGMLLVAAGVLLMGSGMHGLAAYGGGLPMNAYPPPRLANRGIYGWVAHPIYIGFVAAAAGAAIWSGSASGLWLVTPAAALALTALVLGYERHDLRRRFGTPPRPLIALPGTEPGPPLLRERLSVHVLVLLPWLLSYEALHLAGVPRDAVTSHLPFEAGWPVLEWTEAIYASTYAMVVLTPFLVRSRAALRGFAVSGLFATAVVSLIYIAVPLTAPPRPFDPATPLGHLLAFERAMGHTVAAFPAFHVIWPLLAAAALRSRGRVWSLVAHGWALLIAASCITTGMHSLLDVAAALAITPLLRDPARIWATLRRTAEHVANSWREWRAGPVRIINHGFYAGAGGALGAWIAGVVAGPELLGAVVMISIAGLVVAAIWGQFLEGSSVLLRPIGFYGGIAGGLAGIATLALLGLDWLTALLGFALAMPWVQAAGRLRCLVQGCCHGAPVAAHVGIRYAHSRSRVTQIAGLTGTPLHATPLYSLIGNVVTGVLLLRLQMLGAPAGIIIGAYFILNAVVRFVEESYRGEPQTPIVARLRVYQWIAAAGFLIGVAFTLAGPAAIPAAGAVGDARVLGGALLVGIIGWFVTGVDFPGSNLPFSRLAAVDGPPRMLARSAPLRPVAPVLEALQVRPSPPPLAESELLECSATAASADPAEKPAAAR
jgi:protein-S-isoprenylcysteine O-methyltransferase Ste14